MTMRSILSAAATLGVVFALAAPLPVEAQQNQTGQKQTWGTILGGVGGAIIGHRFGRGHRDQTAAALLGGVVGAWAGHAVGRQMDENDRLRAAQAHHDALEFNRAGVASSWQNPDTGHYGSVTPLRTYEHGGTYCREYEQTITVDGRLEQARGTACRQADGSWRIVS